MEAQRTILEFWFGRHPDDAVVAREHSALWWRKKPKTDAEIRCRFEPLVLAAESGDLNGWRTSIEGRLALILLTDQFPRNIYRDAPAAFRFDDIAQNLCLEGLEKRDDKSLRPIQRVFFYMPLEHSENLEHQNRCVELFRELAGEVPPDHKETFAGFINYALRHQAIIERFGRFPYRNLIIRRESTAEEIEFLKQPGSSY